MRDHIPQKIWARGKTTGYYYLLQEGSGSAMEVLTDEELETLVDYIYYDYYEKLSDVHEDKPYDGGCYYLTKPYQDMTIDEILKTIGDFEEETLELIETEEYN